MTDIASARIVAVRFSKVGKLYNFDASKLDAVRVGDSVVVETSRGWQLGEVAQIMSDSKSPEDGPVKAVDRLATPRDLLLRQSWFAKEMDVVSASQARSRELRLHGVKIIAAEYSFDGARLTILFSSENEDKVDLKSLRQDMQRQYAPSQVEFRQIGPRDVAKLLGGMGACGLENRCCSKFLTDFSSISIRMAKEQGISLTPSEITGMCGRLRCCLIYEYETYCQCRQQLPKRNKRVVTPDGEGKVVNLLPLQLKVMVDVVDVGVRQYHKDDLRMPEDVQAGQVTEKPDTDEEDGEGGESQPPAKPQPSYPSTPLPRSGENRPSQPRGNQPTGNRPGSPRPGSSSQQRPGGPPSGSQRPNGPGPGGPGNARRRRNNRDRGRGNDGNESPAG